MLLKSLNVTEASLTRYSLALIAVAAALLFAWPGLFANLFATSTPDGMFMPHIHCYLWVPSLVWLHAASDFLIGLSYVAISLTLAYLINRVRRDIPFHWVFIAFGIFIIACGMTHFMEVVTLNYAAYWLSGYVKLITAAASLATAVVLPPLVPRTLLLISTAKLSEERRVNLEEANRELETLYQKVKQIDDLKTQFFSNVSHELRTPLALILGPAEKLLAADNLNADQHRALELVNVNARNLLKQVNDLLDVAKLEAGKMTLNYAEIDLARALRLTASHFESLALERNLRFEVETPPETRAKVDPDKVQRIFLNLLSNAFKFTPDGGRVRCALKYDASAKDLAVFEVEDTGPGIPKEMREVVFERFRQIESGTFESGTARQFGGTGLGLAITKEFVEMHGGHVTAEASAEGGALFRVELPLDAPAGTQTHELVDETAIDNAEMARQALDALRATELAAGKQVASLAPVRSLAGEAAPLVLVVEDNAEMNRFIVETLADEYRVESAGGGEEGLRKAQALKPDLILSDVMMPGMTGDIFVRELRTHHQLDEVPVVMLTAKADDELRVRLLREGAQDYLMKPFAVEELRARVRHLVSMKRTREVLRRELESREESLEALAREVTERKRELERSLDALRRSETERAQLLESEREARTRAEDSSRLKDEFLANVSHELRLPLTPIIGWANMLRTMEFDEAARQRALATIERNARAQQQIVNDLLDISRIISGKFRFEMQPTDLLAVVEAAAEVVRPAAEAKDISLTIEMTDEPCRVSGDADRLQQVAWNPLSNAVKFTPTGGKVSVMLTCKEDKAEIVVTDTGEGISQQFLPFVFDRFRQADSSSTRRHGGLGLGLSIARSLVELHGGTIKAESEGEGRGALITVQLPLLRDEHEPPTREENLLPETQARSGAPAPKTDILRGISVLVVDDQRDAREVVSIILQTYGAKVVTVEGAAAALDEFDRLRPDVLISDIEMPGEDGYAFIRRVRERDKASGGTVPAIALTAHARQDDYHRALEAGFQQHLAKPVSLEDLVSSVATLVGRK